MITLFFNIKFDQISNVFCSCSSNHSQWIYSYIWRFIFKQYDMKRTFLVTLLMLMGAWTISAQTEGSLTVTVTTSNAGGNYAPRNCVVFWIEDSQGSFVKTMMAYADTRKTHLNTWEASTTAAGSPFNTVDAITGATRTTHATRNCTWNATNLSGAVVPDGTYRIRMELTDKNATGNFSTFTFTKGTVTEVQTPANVPSFSAITIAWEPVITSIEDPARLSDIQIYPNPSHGIFTVRGDGVSWIEVLNSDGTLVYFGKNATVDLSARPDGVYYARIHTGGGIVLKKILKRSSGR